MTFAQQFRQEGRQEERFKIAKYLLAEGSDLQFVKRVTKLSDEEINRLRLHQFLVGKGLLADSR